MTSDEIVTLSVGSNGFTPEQNSQKTQQGVILFRSSEDLRPILKNLEHTIKTNAPTTLRTIGRKSCYDYTKIAHETMQDFLFSARDQTVLRIDATVKDALEELNYSNVMQPKTETMFVGPGTLESQIHDVLSKLPQTHDEFLTSQKEFESRRSDLIELAEYAQNRVGQNSNNSQAIAQLIYTLIELVEEEHKNEVQSWINIQKHRSKAIKGYLVSLNGLYHDFQVSLGEILKKNQSVRRKIEKTREEHHDPFTDLWQNIYKGYKLFLNGISKAIPDELQISIKAEQFFESCDASDEDCCVRRIREMKSRVSQIVRSLRYKLESESSIEDAEEMSRLENSYAKAKRQYEKNQNLIQEKQTKLEEIRKIRIKYWNKAKRDPESYQKLIDAETTARRIENDQNNLLKDTQFLKQKLHRITEELSQKKGQTNLQDLQNAMSLAYEWENRIDRFAVKCHKEQQMWSQRPRGKISKLMYRVREVTLSDVNKLWRQARDKIDMLGIQISKDQTKKIQTEQQKFKTKIEDLTQRKSLTELHYKRYEDYFVREDPEFAERVGRGRHILVRWSTVANDLRCAEISENLLHSIRGLLHDYNMWFDSLKLENEKSG